MKALVLVLLMVCAPAIAAAAVDRESVPPPAPPTRALADSVRYSLRVTDNNQMGLTVTNYGFIGNNFVSRSPSLEYPLGTGYEHLVRGGIWIGAYALAEGDTARAFDVVTGTVDGSQGGGSQGATEFTPAGNDISIRSKLPNNRFFNAQAVSELDLTSSFSDRPARSAANNREPHRPMGLLVTQNNYMWSFSDYQHIIIFHYTITNTGPPLSDVWVGLYGEFASGAKNSYSVWPPSSSGSPFGSWYKKKILAYDDSLRLFREHFCAALPVPGGCNLGAVPYWMGMKVLGVSPGNVADTSDKKITFAAWNWSPGDTLRDEDRERYAIISAGTIQPIAGNPDLQPQSGDPVELLAVGPFREIDPNETISVDFAFVGGAEIEDLQKHAVVAQRAFDQNYIVPVPPPSPLMRVVARDQALDIYWDNSPEAFSDPTSPLTQDFEGYRVYVGENRVALSQTAQFDLATAPHDTTGFNTGLGAARLPTPVTIDGVTYQYKHTVSSLRNGFKYFCAVTAYDIGDHQIESLESGISQNKALAIPGPAAGERTGLQPSVYPNPYRVDARWDAGQLVRDHYLWFVNLPERATLKIFTLSGDLVFQTAFDGATYHGEGARGIYNPSNELDVSPPTLSGRNYGWNMISSEGQAVASGLYLFSVEDRATNKRTVGKFLIVKSDREEF